MRALLVRSRPSCGERRDAETHTLCRACAPAQWEQHDRCTPYKACAASRAEYWKSNDVSRARAIGCAPDGFDHSPGGARGSRHTATRKGLRNYCPLRRCRSYTRKLCACDVRSRRWRKTFSRPSHAEALKNEPSLRGVSRAHTHSSTGKQRAHLVRRAFGVGCPVGDRRGHARAIRQAV